VVCLISGGGSALLVLPHEGLTLEDKQAVNRALLRSGASIAEMNCLRRHLSAIKGGRLAAACHPARVVTMLLSDVPGDNPMDIASGPTVADSTTCADAADIIRRYAIEVPPAVHEILASGRGESVKPGDPRLAGNEVRMVATPQMALEAAAAVAKSAGLPALILGDAIEGEARDVGKVMAGIALQVATHGQPVPAPCVLLSGGETTVTVRGNGAAGATSSFCCRSPWPSMAILASTPSPAIPTGWTDRRRSPVLISRRTASPAPGRRASVPATALPTTTATVFSKRSATRW